ncbi:hypothetical protein P7K49_027496 [Saguinus oedipus]|uniref:Uncharacterized protein n=1 Tax=Saguinus oedipus TaxID=9490 RepID=A0ABQ9UAW0_SAGOE|nr:hypothetical protein P7K49_027496 [Saguinus oedipus]
MNLHNKLMSRTRNRETTRLIAFGDFHKLHYFQAIPAEPPWPGAFQRLSFGLRKGGPAHAIKTQLEIQTEMYSSLSWEELAGDTVAFTMVGWLSHRKLSYKTESMLNGFGWDALSSVKPLPVFASVMIYFAD